MKEERLAVLSMVEKGIITVDEAERLLKALNETAVNDKEESVLSKAGVNISSFAKIAAEKAEKMIDDAKPVVKKAVDDTAPKMKKFSERATELTNKFVNNVNKKKNSDSEDEVSEDDFEKGVNIMPLSGTESNTTEKTDNKEEKE